MTYPPVEKIKEVKFSINPECHNKDNKGDR